jgi:hypothetical protein
MARLDELRDRPVSEHGEVYADLHERLQSACGGGGRRAGRPELSGQGSQAFAARRRAGTSWPALVA